MKPGAKLGLWAGPGAGAVVSAASLGTSGRVSCATAPPAKGSRKASAPTRAHDNAVVHQTRLVDLLGNPLIPPPRPKLRGRHCTDWASAMAKMRNLVRKCRLRRLFPGARSGC